MSILILASGHGPPGPADLLRVQAEQALVAGDYPGGRELVFQALRLERSAERAAQPQEAAS